MDASWQMASVSAEQHGTGRVGRRWWIRFKGYDRVAGTFSEERPGKLRYEALGLQVPFEKVGLGWVPGGFKYILRRYWWCRDEDV